MLWSRLPAREPRPRYHKRSWAGMRPRSNLFVGAAVGCGFASEAIGDPGQIKRFRRCWRAEMVLLAGQLDACDITAQFAHLLPVELTHDRGNNRILCAPVNNDRCN